MGQRPRGGDSLDQLAVRLRTVVTLLCVSPQNPFTIHSTVRAAQRRALVMPDWPQSD